jgi:hypothetical protein
VPHPVGRAQAVKFGTIYTLAYTAYCMCDQHDASIDGHTIEIAKANLGGNKIKMDLKLTFYLFRFLKKG